MHADTRAYNEKLEPDVRKICDRLAREIDRGLKEAENKVWHAHPVWFLDGNPVVGYSKLKDCVRLLFWSGQSFDEPGLAKEGSFKAAEARYKTLKAVNVEDVRWLAKARDIQWDYKNIVKRKGRLLRLKGMTAEDAIRAMVERETSAWNQKDAEALVDLFHPDMVWPWPPDGDRGLLVLRTGLLEYGLRD